MTFPVAGHGRAPAAASALSLDEMFGDLAPHDVAAILEVLGSDIDAAIADLEQAARDADARKARRAAHRLAGLLGHCGSDATTALAAQLSAACDDDDALSLVAALAVSAEAARNKFQELS